MLTEIRQELARVARGLRKDKGPIIIVEDDTDDQLLLWREVKFLLGDAPVQTFSNGVQLMEYLDKGREAGEKAFKKERPRLILLDLHMPKMDGFKTLDKLMKAKDVADIPVVVVSGTRSDDDVTAARNHGAKAFLSKPFSRGDWVFF
jgi:CheY-like chemotaxis protein